MQHLSSPSLSRRSFLVGGAAATAAVAGLSLTACGSSDAPIEGGSTEGGSTSGSSELRAGVSYQTDNFLPMNNSSGLAQGANWNVVEGLYMLDMANGCKPYPALADGEPTEVSDTEYEVKLRADAKFSNGNPVTAEDVVSSYTRCVEADGSLYAPMLSFIDSMEAKDDITVTIKLNKPTSLLTTRLPLVVVVPKDATDEELTKMPIGSGPFKYEAVNGQEGGQLVFVKNDQYNGQNPALVDKITYDVIVDDTSRASHLQDGTDQIMENVPATLVAQVSGTGASVENVQGFAVAFMMFNTKKAPFDDPRVRQAFLYAIDYEKMIQNALPDVATRPQSFLPESHVDYTGPATNDFNHDVDKAKQLLDEAGVKDLSIVLDTTDAGWIAGLATQIQQDLQAVGVTAEISSQASSSLYANRCDTDDAVQPFDIVVAPGDPGCFGTDPDLLMNWWYGDNSWTEKRSSWKGSEGYEKLHELMDQAFAAEGSEQKDLWKQCFDLLSEEVPLYPIVHRQVVTAFLDDKVNNFLPIGCTGLQFKGVSAK